MIRFGGHTRSFREVANNAVQHTPRGAIPVVTATQCLVKRFPNGAVEFPSPLRVGGT